MAPDGRWGVVLNSMYSSVGTRIAPGSAGRRTCCRRQMVSGFGQDIDACVAVAWRPWRPLSNRDDLSPERFLLILQGVQNSAFRHRDPASLKATRYTTAPVPDPYAHPRPPPAAALSVRRVCVAAGAQLQIPSQPRPPPGGTRPPPLRVSRSGRPTPGTAPSSRPMAARHPDRRRHRGRQLHRQLPEPVIGHARRALYPRCTEARTTRARRRGRQTEISRPWPSEQIVSFGSLDVPPASGCCPMALAFLSRVPASAGSDKGRLFCGN